MAAARELARYKLDLVGVQEVRLDKQGTLRAGDHNFFSMENESRRMRWAGPVARMGVERGVHRVLVGKPEGKRPLGRPKCTCRWEDNSKMDLQDVGGGCGDWRESAQDRDRWRTLVGTVKNFRVP
jgi:hypothetical protein